MVHGIEKGLKVYKEEKIIRPMCASNEILRNTSIWSIYYVAGLCLGLDLKYSCVPWVQHWIRNHETWNDLLLNDLILVETGSDVFHLFYLLSIMIWVCLKSGIAAKFWVKILRSVRRFISAKWPVHAGSTLSSSIYKNKNFFSNLTDLSNQTFFLYYCLSMKSS